MARYDEVLILKEKSDYSLEEKAKFFNEVWDLAKAYYDNYADYGGDNGDEECEFRVALKGMATAIVFPHADEDGIIELIDELEEENAEEEDD